MNRQTAKLHRFPEVAECLPHAGAMVLLDEICRVGENFAECSLRVKEDCLTRNSLGEVPIWVGIEYMAQCAAVVAGCSNASEAPKVGFLLGSRKVECRAEAFYLGQELRVRAELTATMGTMCSFACTVCDERDGKELVSATLNVYLLND